MRAQDFPLGGDLESFRNGLAGFAPRDGFWHRARKIDGAVAMTNGFCHSPFHGAKIQERRAPTFK